MDWIGWIRGPVGPALQWLDAHPGTASWLGAIGSITAIVFVYLFALYQGRRTRSHENTDRIRRAQGPGLNYDALKPAYTDPAVWDNFEPGLLTLCSPDPQAIRPPDEKVNVLQVTLPTNFKVAKFDNDKYTAILRKLQADVEAVRYDTPEGKIELPVKLKVSVFAREAHPNNPWLRRARCLANKALQKDDSNIAALA